MLKKKLSIVFVVLLFLSIVFVIEPHDKLYRVTEVLSPSSFELDSEKFVIKDLSTFDSKFTERNKVLSKNLGITENEAFILGNLAKYWASDLMKGRTVYKKSDDLIYFKYSYKTKFMHSGYCLIDSKPYSQKAFEKRLSSVRNTKYKVMDIVSGNVFDIADSRVKTLKEFIIIRKNHVPKESKTLQIPAWNKQKIEQGDLKIYFADFTTNLKPDRSCSSAICKEILNNINGAKKTIDMAIYGYSRTPEIETALEKAVNRGVKIRLVYDLDSKGSNIYPDTKVITNLVPDNKNDGCSEEYANIMHNKFYIFDDETLITGSANLSHTDMSGFNTNSIVVLKSKEAARIYKQEFEQMYSGKFHNQKVSAHNKNLILSEVPVKIYFSPQDKAVSNCVIPLIKNAKKYIYIPTFVLTENRVKEALIEAKNRGVDVKIIIDALSASNKHSKHNELRLNGISVKTENYAGKMHSKSMIVDNEYTIIGSMNFSNSGEKRNDENLVLIQDKNIAGFYRDFFLYQWNKIDDKWLKYSVAAESPDSIGSCTDGIDNDYDGLIDSQESVCK